MPLANRFLAAAELKEKELTYPLEVYLCGQCHLVQLADVVSPEILFGNYAYFTGVSKDMTRHLQELAHEAFVFLRRKRGAGVLDIGSNDGTLLVQFSELGFRTLGVEPASNIASIARENGIRTINAFFDISVAHRILKEEGKCDIISATNVFAHVDDLDSFVEAAKLLLTDDGFLVIEVPYLVDMIRNTEFDTIYHEHLSYFRVQPLSKFFIGHGLKIVRVKRVPVHGGSIRLYVSKEDSQRTPKPSVARFEANEEKLGFNSEKPYRDFADRVVAIRDDLRDMLATLKGQEKKIAGYGAAAKGNTLLNWCKIGPDTIEYIVDDTPAKQGKFTPGTKIPIVSRARLSDERPDYLLILAWNWLQEIMRKEASYMAGGGRFIVPIPTPRILPVRKK
jgi:novobiocin biosynthesis protein NovU/D-mycarose 3-C-methyltransferase